MNATTTPVLVQPIDRSSAHLFLFFALAFGIAWGVLGGYLIFPEAIASQFGVLGYTHPLFILAVYAPAIAGVVVVLRMHGLRGLLAFAQRLTMWRMSWPWWCLLLVVLPAVSFLGAAVKGTLNTAFPFATLGSFIAALTTAAVIGPVEEIGWRGVALPLLQRTMAPFWAGLALGVLWALWHLPAFFLSGTPQSGWSLPGFFLGCIALSIILTPMFNASGGSILLSMLFHLQLNNPAWPDAQPWDAAIFVALAFVAVWINRRALFERHSAVTSLLVAARLEGR